MESKDTISAFSSLPPEIIHEIVKHYPGSSSKLALTCKEMNENLQEQLNRIHKIIERNNKLYDIDEKIGEMIVNRGFHMNEI
jgi:hypothetical protein